MAVAQTRISLNSKISFEIPDGTVKFEDTEHSNKMKEAFTQMVSGKVKSVFHHPHDFKHEHTESKVD